MKRYVMAGLGILFFGAISAVHAEMEVKVKNNTTNNGLSIKEETTGSTIARFRGDGKVGIGTTDPLAKLTVYGTSHQAAIRIQSDDNTYPYLQLFKGNTNNWQWYHGNNNELNLQYNGNNSMIITNVGNVGIGTINPSEKFDVNGDMQAKNLKLKYGGIPIFSNIFNLNSTTEHYILSTNDWGSLRVHTDKNITWVGWNPPITPSLEVRSHSGSWQTRGQRQGINAILSRYENDTSGPSLYFVKGRAEPGESQSEKSALRAQNGDTIGSIVWAGYNNYTPYPSSASIVAVVTNGNKTWSNDASVGADLLFYTNPGVNTSDLYERMRINKEGNVGIGYTSPSYKLDVFGMIRGNNVSPSDMRWKEHVKILDNSLEKVNKLRGVSFEWKDKAKGTGTQIGLIAQEVEKVFPEVISEDNEGYKSVAYDKLVGVLIEAVKEQQRQIEELKAERDIEIVALKASNEALKQEISSIKEFMSTHAQSVTVPASAQIR